MSTQPLTRAEIAKQPTPTCLVCGGPVGVDWICVTLNLADQAENGDRYIRGLMSCPRGCNPLTGARFHGEQDLSSDIDGTFSFTCSCGHSERGTTTARLAELHAQHPLGCYTTADVNPPQG